MQIGGVTVFGLPADLPIWVDARVMTRERIVLGRRIAVLEGDRVAGDPAARCPGVEVGRTGLRHRIRARPADASRSVAGP